MEGDVLGLTLLLATLAVAVAGVLVFVSAGIRQESVASRSIVGERQGAGRLTRRLDDLVRQTSWGASAHQRLRGAGLRWRAVDYIALMVACGVAGGVAVNLLFPVWLAVVVGLACTRLAGAFVNWQAERRRAAFVAQLPELARVLSNGTQAGLSIAGAIELAARELDDPARSELQRTIEEMRIGQPLADALHQLGERMPSRELGVLVTTVAIQQRLGGDVVKALHEMAQTLDERKDLIREVRTVMSGSVFTAWLVGGLGASSLLLVNALNPGTLDDMASDPLGLLCLAVASLFYGAAFLLVRQTVKVDL